MPPSPHGPRLVLALVPLLAPLAGAGTLFVDASRTTGADDGSSWDDAFQGIDGLTRALALAAPGDRVFVARGTYVPGRFVADSFAVPSAVELYGSFLGNESSPEERPPREEAPTVLSGDLFQDDDSSTFVENANHVLTAHGTAPTTLLDGFVVRAGRARGGNEANRGGGLLGLGDCNLTVRNCRFVDNSATFVGGAVSIAGPGSQPRFEDCVFEQNVASRSGAVDASAPLTLERCVLRGNRAGFGSAIEVSSDGAVVSNCLIVDNGATVGSGAVSSFTGTFYDLVNTTVVGNRGAVTGGLRVSPGLGSGGPRVRNCVFWANVGAGASSPTLAQISSGVDVARSLVQGGYPGTANLAVDPEFLDLAARDLRPAPGSPLVDAGDVSAVPPGVFLDVDRAPRFTDDPTVPDTGAGAPPLVDLGAHEFQPPLAEVLCSGDGSGAPCPCQDGEPGAGCSNSTGQGGLLAASGTASLFLDDLVLTAEALPAARPALLFAGNAPLAGGGGLPFGDGLLCVGGSVTRLGIRTTNAAGSATWGPGLAAMAGWTPGSTRYLQAWYRDPASPCGGGFNLTQALAVRPGP